MSRASGHSPIPWDRIEAALDELIEAPPAELREQARRLSEGDPALERELLSLVAGLEVSDDPLERGFDGSAGRLLEGLEAELIEEVEARYQRLGAYRLGDLIGVGGMGRVYRARRADGLFDRAVAVKILRWELSQEALVPRFESERRILADLEHPAIARMLDGGVTDDGVPYLVMDLVEGLPIDQFCREGDLEGRAIVGVVLPVVEAVDYAHRRLVIHRDLKPANILVQDDGRPKLLDFGVAKLLDPSRQAGLTVGDGAPYTPSFAAPEQLRGEAASTATDVYALGCLLYLLLARRLPFEAAPDRPDPRLQGRVPRPPSAFVSGRADRELDAIVLKCLHPEVEGRYPGAGALAADLEAWLEGMPVRAVPPSGAYRLRKFLRRHALASVFAGLALVSLLSGMAAALHQGAVARHERDRAQSLADLSLEILRLGDPQDFGGGRISVQELLEAGAEKAERIQDPATRGRVLAVIGEGLANLEVMASAADHLMAAAAAFEQSAEHRERIPEVLLRAAEPLASSGRLEAGLQASAEAIRRVEEASGTQETRLAAALYGRAFLLVRYADHTDPRREEARSLLEGAAEMQRRAAPQGSEELAKSLHLLGMFLAGEFRKGGAGVEGTVEKGLDLMRRAAEMRSALGGPDGRAMIDSLNDLALSLDSLGRFDEGFEVMRRAMAIADERLEASNSTLLSVRQNLAAFYRDAGQFEEARRLYQGVVDQARGAGMEPAGVALFGLARVTAGLGDLAAAEVLAREGFEFYADSDIRHWILGELLGEIWRRQGRFSEAGSLLGETLEEFEKRQGKDSPRARSTRRELDAARRGSRAELWVPPRAAPGS
ncbi:MAG: serine/threonine-protein kinase [Acidobacteriota bacterium]